MTRKQKRLLTRILLSAGLMAVVEMLPLSRWGKFALVLVPYLISGYDVLWRAVKGILHGQVFDENFLMAIATLGAMGLAVGSTGDYIEAVAVMVLYQTGELFQSIALHRSRRSITALMDLTADTARWVREDGQEEEVSSEAVPAGSIIAVHPGERIPLDGEILTGSSTLNTASLTGESLPRNVEAGDMVQAGCVNLTGVLHIRTSGTYGESTAVRMLSLMEHAASHKAQREAFIASFARVYTPVVCIIAFLLAVVPPMVETFWLQQAGNGWRWVYRALSFLVISCPCALVISVPMTFFAGLGRASREGILVKGGHVLEALAKTKTVAMDKTGTLTTGVFHVSQVTAISMPEEELLTLAALAESASSHPLAQALCRAAKVEEAAHWVADIHEEAGLGVSATVDGQRVLAGNRRWLTQQGVELPTETDAAGAVIHVAVEGVYAGGVELTDTLRPKAAEAISELQQLGVTDTTLLTGDHAAAAQKVAQALHLTRVAADLMPDDKLHHLEALLAAKPKDATLVYVGDGMNDAPALCLADVGMAMGGLGTDAAIEAADVVLMDDDIAKVPKALRLSKRVMAIVRQNIVMVLVVKIACLLLSALGLANMGVAIFADVGIMVLAVLNALRVMR